MWFWIRNISLLLMLGGIAYVILVRPDLLRSDSVNIAATGFSNFYGKIRVALADNGKDDSDYKISLPDTSDTLTRQLLQRAKSVTPADVNWRGKITDRRFREGDTVKTVLTNYARKEGIQLFWTLPRDYVVKQYFQTDTTLIATIDEISQAIAPDFMSPVLSFYCPAERAAVVTDKVNDYLQQNCIPANTAPVVN